MSNKSIKEFLRNSNVNIQSPGSTSSLNTANAELAREIEEDLVSRENFINNDYIRNLPQPFTISKLNPGIYNIVVNKAFTPKASRVDISYILKKSFKNVDNGRTPIGFGLTINVSEIKGYYGQFRTGISISREYGVRGNMNQNYFAASIVADVSNGEETKGISFTIYRNGKIRFSGGFIGSQNIDKQPDAIRKYLIDNFTAGNKFLYSDLEYNNLSGQFKVNGSINMIGVARTYPSSVSYEPEITPFLYMTHKGYKYILTGTGVIQLSGVSNPAQMLSAYDTGSQLATELYSKGLITGLKGFNKKITRSKTSRKTATSCPVARRPPCKSGFEVRKNPQGSECCYKIPKKKGKKTKSKTNDTNKPLNITRNNDGLKIGGRKCMRLTQSTLLDVAKKMGVVGVKKSTKKDELCEMIDKINAGGVANFKVGKRDCRKYKKEELVFIAIQRGIKVTDKDTIISLCEKLKIKQDTNKSKKKQIIDKKINNKKKKAQQNVDNKMERRRLTDSAIKNDIIKLYGKRWMNKYKNVMPSINSDVREFKTLLNNAKNKTPLVNKKGVLRKQPVNDMKKNMVSAWKLDREANLKIKLVRQTYGNAAANYVKTNPKATKAQIESFVKKYTKMRKNLNNNKKNKNKTTLKRASTSKNKNGRS